MSNNSYDTNWANREGLTVDGNLDDWTECRLVSKNAPPGTCGAVDKNEGFEIDNLVTFEAVQNEDGYLDNIVKIGDGQCMAMDTYLRLPKEIHPVLGHGKLHPYTRQFIKCGNTDFDDELWEEEVEEETLVWGGVGEDNFWMNDLEDDYMPTPPAPQHPGSWPTDYESGPPLELPPGISRDDLVEELAYLESISEQMQNSALAALSEGGEDRPVTMGFLSEFRAVDENIRVLRELLDGLITYEEYESRRP